MVLMTKYVDPSERNPSFTWKIERRAKGRVRRRLFDSFEEANEAFGRLATRMRRSRHWQRTRARTCRGVRQ